jgi:heme/copper-type cytochrome/quinol oxidase subunit 2
VFSIFGIIFLSIVAMLLQQNSLYLKVSAANNDKKQDLVRGVMGAIIMYVICLGVSAYVLFTSSRYTAAVESPRLDD